MSGDIETAVHISCKAIEASVNIFSLLLYRCSPESVRWLLKKGRVLEAKETLAKVAKVNGKVMPDAALKLPNDEKMERLGDFRDLFSSTKMAHKTLACWFMW